MDKGLSEETVEAINDIESGNTIEAKSGRDILKVLPLGDVFSNE